MNTLDLNKLLFALPRMNTSMKCCTKNEIQFEEDNDALLVNIGQETSDFHPDGSWMIQGCECSECLICKQPELPDTPRPGAKAKTLDNGLAISRAVEGINCPACIAIRKHGRSTSRGCWYHDLCEFSDYYQA